MRLIALSILILAGALMTGFGVIANGMPNSQQHYQLDTCGLVLTVLGIVMFIIEWWPTPQEATPRPASRTAH